MPFSYMDVQAALVLLVLAVFAGSLWTWTVRFLKARDRHEREA